MLAWILKMKPEKKGSSGVIRPWSLSRGRGGGVKDRKRSLMSLFYYGCFSYSNFYSYFYDFYFCFGFYFYLVLNDQRIYSQK